MGHKIAGPRILASALHKWAMHLHLESWSSLHFELLDHALLIHPLILRSDSYPPWSNSPVPFSNTGPDHARLLRPLVRARIIRNAIGPSSRIYEARAWADRHFILAASWRCRPEMLCLQDQISDQSEPPTKLEMGPTKSRRTSRSLVLPFI